MRQVGRMRAPSQDQVLTPSTEASAAAVLLSAEPAALLAPAMIQVVPTSPHWRMLLRRLQRKISIVEAVKWSLVVPSEKISGAKDEVSSFHGLSESHLKRRRSLRIWRLVFISRVAFTCVHFYLCCVYAALLRRLSADVFPQPGSTNVSCTS